MKENNNSPSPLGIVVIGLVVMFIFFGGFFVYKNMVSGETKTQQAQQTDRSSPLPVAPEKQSKESPIEPTGNKVLDDLAKAEEYKLRKEKELLNNFFSEQEKGLSGKGKFCFERNAVSFYAVRSWKIVNELSAGMFYTVRVESSTKGGLPITALWEVMIVKNNGEFCISSITEK